jgi:lysophospholipid acyltransferase (LPLAT)-like uncharacterized protein
VLRWHEQLIAWLIYASIQLITLTLRYRYQFPAGFLEAPDRPLIFCGWHNRLLLSLTLYRHYVKLRRRPHRLVSIVSASRDGAMLARILEHFEVEPVRGSSSRRGPQALLEMTRWAERGYDIAMLPDGPRGPVYKIKPGIVYLAHLSGAPIIPISYHLNWKICLKSWDRFQVPLPFSRVSVIVGEALSVPRDATEEELEKQRVELENRLTKLTVD